MNKTYFFFFFTTLLLKICCLNRVVQIFSGSQKVPVFGLNIKKFKGILYIFLIFGTISFFFVWKIFEMTKVVIIYIDNI